MSRRVGGILVSLVFAGLIVALHSLVYRLLVMNGLLAIQEVVVEGNQYLSREEVIHLTGLHPGMGMFDFSWDVVIGRLTNSSSIRSAEGERLLPGVVRIRIEEDFPVGVLVVGTNAWFVKSDGRLLLSARSPHVPRIDVEYPLALEQGRIQDEWVLAVVKNLAKVTNRDRIARIRLNREEGAHVFLRSMPTDFWVGHETMDETVWQKIFALEEEIVGKKLALKQINLHRENAIGYQ
jgi:hypothetical protein